MKKRVEYDSPHAVIVEMATLHTGACTRNRVITYSLDLLSWIHGAVHTKGRAEYQAGTNTRRWGLTYPLIGSMEQCMWKKG